MKTFILLCIGSMCTAKISVTIPKKVVPIVTRAGVATTKNFKEPVSIRKVNSNVFITVPK